MIFSKDFQWISSLKEAIHQKVVPKAKYLSAIFVGFLVLILISCSSTRHAVEVVEHSIHDTLYMSNIQHDSIYINQEHDRDYHRGNLKLSETAEGLKLIETVDTIFIKDVATQYKYKLLRDTTYINRVDSIPIIKEVTVTKEVKYTPWYTKALAWIGVICLMIIVLYVILKFVLKR